MIGYSARNRWPCENFPKPHLLDIAFITLPEYHRTWPENPPVAGDRVEYLLVTPSSQYLPVKEELDVGPQFLQHREALRWHGTHTALQNNKLFTGTHVPAGRFL